MTHAHLASLVLAVSLGLSACSRSRETAEAAFHDSPASRIAIAVTADGFVPTQALVKAGPIRHACAMHMVSGELVAE